MNIEKALEHFKWKFDNVQKPSTKDIKAFNSILEWKETQESINLQRNESLAKLWIHQLILLNESNLYSAERAIQVIDEILNKSVYDWTIILKDKISIMRFNAILLEKGMKPLANDLNLTKARLSVLETLSNHKEELEKEFTSEITEENTIKFVEKQINRIITKYEK
jgi:hypothetical protein